MSLTPPSHPLLPAPEGQPTAPMSRWRRLIAPTAAIGGLAAATAALHFRDPHGSGTWGYCPSALMGFYCPGCGGLRAVNDLTNLQFGAALSSNVLVVAIIIPLGIVALGAWWWSAYTGRPGLLSRFTNEQRVRAALVLLVVMVTFAVFRNLPVGAWFAP